MQRLLNIAATTFCICVAILWVAFCYIAMQRLTEPQHVRTVCAEVQPSVIVCDKQSVSRYSTPKGAK